MTVAVEIRALRKVYGRTAALDGVDLLVPEGSVFGFLGPNGAGKTTTLRILTGLARPTSGSVRVLGYEAGFAESQVRASVGYLPDVPGFYDWMTGEEFLRFAGGLFSIDAPTLAERVRVLLDLAGLTGVRTPIGGYSRGMKQRLGVAQALINAPQLLMLDEPTSALDPMGRREVLEMISSLRGRTTVLFSTHILADVERVCDTVAILDRGRVVAQAPIGDLKARYGTGKVIVEVAEGRDALAVRLAGAPWAGDVRVTDDGALAITVSDSEAAARAIPALVSELGLPLTRVEAGEVGLEEAFMEIIAAAEGSTGAGERR